MRLWKLMIAFYNIISIWIPVGLLLAFGLTFLFTGLPDNRGLSNYRKARYTMACAYLFFAGITITEYFFSNASECNIPLLQVIVLIIAVSQAFLFAYTLLALLTVKFSGWWYLFQKSIPIILFILAVVVVYFFGSEACFKAAFYGFAGGYAFLLLFYTRLFLSGYRQFRTKMDNYFSDLQAKQLHWVAFSFFAALTIGIMALLSVVFISIVIVLLFSVTSIVFYTYFAIRFLGYPYLFQTLEAAMTDELPEETPPTETETPIVTDNTAFAILEKRINQWVADKGFTQQGITINILSKQLITNRSYLSEYINTREKKTFREWINKLRIEEAQKLMLQYPQMTISEIAIQTGFSDTSNFRRLFSHFTKFKPQEWRKANTQS